MSNILFFYFFILSILLGFRYVWRFFISVVSTPPKPMRFENVDYYLLIFSLSYIITYIVKF